MADRRSDAAGNQARGAVGRPSGRLSPVIHTERLTLRPAGPEYLASTYAYASDLESTRLMMFLPVESLDEQRRLLEAARAEWAKPAPSYFEYAILMDGVHVGGITLYMSEDWRDEAELGWIVHRDHWRRGIAFEAASALMVRARRELGVRRVFAQCDAENAASYHLMEKLGMRCVGRDGRRKNRSSDEERRELTYEIRYDGD